MYSSIMSKNWIIKAEEKEIANKADLYARDIGLFSQMACSSPSSLILLKDSLENTEESLLSFFEKCNSALAQKEWLSECHSLDNFKSSVEVCMKLPEIDCMYKGNNFAVFSVKKNHIKNNINFKPKDACIFIYEVNSIEEAVSLLPKNNQTIVCIGLIPEIKQRLAKQAMLKGTNRLVNVGNALSMNIFWDGYDVISFLSKLVCFE